MPSDELVQEIKDFETLCNKRYRFNNAWDVTLTVAGILLGVGVIAAGAYKKSELTAILGGFVTAVVSAQRAFPFSQRAQFYRSLVGQASNLATDLGYGLITVEQAVKALDSLRLDFAQQLPRGTSTTSGAGTPPGGPAPAPPSTPPAPTPAAPAPTAPAPAPPKVPTAALAPATPPSTSKPTP